MASPPQFQSLLILREAGCPESILGEATDGMMPTTAQLKGYSCGHMEKPGMVFQARRDSCRVRHGYVSPSRPTSTAKDYAAWLQISRLS